METLAKKYPQAIEALTNGNFPNIVKMCSMFYRNKDMDIALGYNGAVSNWMRLATVPSRESEERATKYISTLAVNSKETKPVESNTNKTEKETMVLINVKNNQLQKLSKILGMFGIEFVEID